MHPASPPVSRPSMASEHERLRALKAFDDTKAGIKGLVDAGVTTVPSIFHHPPESLPLRDEPTRRFAIPVIDLASSERASVVGAAKAAAETVGFFQVVNHGVPDNLLAEMLASVRRFHELPVEAKRPYYSRDYGRRVQFNSNFDLFVSPAASWRDTMFLEMPLAPEEIPVACRAVTPEYARQVQRLGRTLFELLSEALGMNPRYLEEETMCLEEGLSLGGYYYPACPEPHLTLGTTRHSDLSFLTVLLQDAVGGLQVLVSDGLEEDNDDRKSRKSTAWVDVPAVAGALVVNVGDYLQIMSNDRFKSVEHRVVAKSVGPRVSVACFFRPDASTRVLVPIVSDGKEARYRSTTVEELLRHYRAKGLDRGTSVLHHFRL